MDASCITITTGETILARDVKQFTSQLDYWIDGDGTLPMACNIDLDCSDLKQIDGSGIGFLANCHSKLVLDSRELKLHNVTGQPASMLKTLGIYELLTGEINV